MNTKLIVFRSSVLVALLGFIGSSVSCMTTYDTNGRPVQSVDPGLAVAGVAAAGVLGYALANDQHDHYYHGRPVYYAGGGYYNYRGGGRAYRGGYHP